MAKRFATRLYGRDDGLEYTGEVYPTLTKAIKGAKEAVKDMKAEGVRLDWNVCEWIEENGCLGRYGQILAGSDI